MIIRKIRLYPMILIAFLSCSGFAPETGEKREAMKTEIENLIQDRMEQAGITGMAAAVVYEGEVFTARGYGYRDGKTAALPVREDTLFQIASVSKIPTALAVMQLAEKGIIDLDADIRTYLPDFHPKVLKQEDAPVSIRDLLTHHSGLPSFYMKDYELESCDPDYFMKTSSLLSEEYLTWEGGTVFAYNNVGFSLLGELVGTVSGMPYKEYMEKNIFLPAGMPDAQLYLENLQDPRVSGGFTRGEPEKLMYIWDIPAGGFLFSSRDMGAFVQTLLACSRGESEKLLRTETLRSMFVQQNKGIPMDADLQMGLAFSLKEQDGHLRVEHNGNLPPFHSSMMLLPEEGDGVFLTANDNAGGSLVMDGIAEDVLAVLTGTENETTPAEQDKAEPQTSPGFQDLSGIAGYYNAGNIGVIQMTWQDSRLLLECPRLGVSSAPLEAGENGSLTLKEAPLRFIPSETGFFCYWGEYYIGPVIPVEKTLLPDSWKPRLGRYIPVTPPYGDLSIHRMTLSYDPSLQFLILEPEIPGDKLKNALTPLSDTLLQVQGYGRDMGSVVEFDESHAEGDLKYGGIWFVRED